MLCSVEKRYFLASVRLQPCAQPSIAIARAGLAALNAVYQLKKVVTLHVYHKAKTQTVASGNLFFTGEHLSDEFQGYRNAAAQTG
ncbi:hypothetical protein BH10CHL1_BH10CHL1_39400 [soil metagenome]